MASILGNKTVTDNLVLCLDTENVRSYAGIGTAWTDLSGKGNSAISYGPGTTGGAADTFTCWLAARYNYSWSHYVVDYNVFGSGASSDRNGGLYNATDPDININVGDTLILDTNTQYSLNNAAGPTSIKTAPTTGSGNRVTNPTATNNGTRTSNITWTPTVAGTYYYQNESRVNMWGKIIVSEVKTFKSFDFKSSDDRILLPNTAQPNGLGSQFTIEIWNYWNDSSAPANAFGGALFTNGGGTGDWNSGAGGDNGLIIGFNYITRKNGSGTQVNTAYSPAPAVQTWHQTVFTLSSGTGNVYVDKVNVMSNNTDFQSNYDQVTGTSGIGIADLNSGSYRGEMNGYIPIVRIYDKVLSTAEIEQNYNALKGRYGL